MIATTELLELTRSLTRGLDETPGQGMLFGFVHLDDMHLSSSPEAQWFHILHEHEWSQYAVVENGYYNALRAFNEHAAAEAAARQASRQPNPETKDEARQRLLFERVTMGNDDVPVIHADPDPATATTRVSPPLVGRRPKDFTSLLKAFVGVSLMGDEPEPENVFKHLKNNPAFARACGFTWPRPSGVYRKTDVPSLRKLEQFDQIMTDQSLWKAIKLREIRTNISSGVIKREDILVHDTTHLHAHSSFETVKYETEQGEEAKKSSSKPTKRCGCKDWAHCPHPWEACDPGAGTVVKAGNKMYWAHKASVLSLGRQEIVLDAFAVSDASSHDGRTIEPSLDRLFKDLPCVKDWFTTLLDDGAADDKELKERLRTSYDLRLICSLNPRRRNAVTEDLGRGVKEIRPNGDVICWAGHSFDYRSMRIDHEVFNFGPPLSEDGVVLCGVCPEKAMCCPNAEKGRHITVPFDTLPQIDPDDPLSKRFKAMLARRPSIERAIKRIKCDLGGDTLGKRGNQAFQARLDKTLIAYHMLLRCEK